MATYLNSREDGQERGAAQSGAARQLFQLGVRSRRAAHSAAGYDIAGGRLTKRREELIKVHPAEWLTTHSGHGVTAIIVCLLPVLAWAADAFLLGAAAEYYASRIFSDSSLQTVAKFLCPAIFVGFEMYLGIRLAKVQELLRSGAAGWRDAFVWYFLVSVAAIIVPCMTIATSLTNGELPPTTTLLLLAGLLGFSLVSHGVILGSGDKIAESYSLLRFHRTLSSFGRELNRIEDARRASVHQAIEFFESYARDLEQFRTNFPQARVQSVFFDAEVRKVINDALGYEAVVSPEGGRTPGHSNGSASSATSNSYAPNGQNSNTWDHGTPAAVEDEFRTEDSEVKI